MKMKKLLLACSALLAVAVNPINAQTEIVTVSMEKLFDGYYKSSEANERLQSLQATAQEEAQVKVQELQGVEAEVQTMREDLENPMLSDDAKAEKEEEIRQKIMEGRQMQQGFQQWQQQTSADIQRESNEIRMSLIDEIVKVVNDVALKEYNADLVLDTSDIANVGVPTVLYSATKLDITDKVMVELNKNAPNN